MGDLLAAFPARSGERQHPAVTGVPQWFARAPVAGALLIWQNGGEFKDTGHVAIITQLLDNKIRIAEQNVIHTPLPPGQQWTRELDMVVENGCYTLRDTFDDTHDPRLDDSD